jgi:hypothetical protein
LFTPPCSLQALSQFGPLLLVRELSKQSFRRVIGPLIVQSSIEQIQYLCPDISARDAVVWDFDVEASSNAITISTRSRLPISLGIMPVPPRQPR